MPLRKAARAAAPDGASDPRRTDQLSGVIGPVATLTSPSRQAQQVVRRLYGWQDVADLQVGGRA
jgi:hypothetical protein